MPETQRTAFESYLKAFSRRKAAFLLVFLVALAGLGALTLLIRPSYKTTSRVAIADLKQMRTPDFLDVYLPGASTLALSGDTYVALIQGLPMADKIAERLSGEGVFVDGERIQTALKAEYFDPDMIEITARNPDSLRAIAVANASAEVFVDENRDGIRRELSHAVDFITKELTTARSEWLDAQTRMTDFRTKEHVAFMDSYMSANMSEQTDIEKELDLLDTKISAGRAKSRALDSLLSNGTTVHLNPLEDPTLVALTKKLADLETDLAVARGEYSDGQSEVKLALARRDEVQNEIDARMKQLASTPQPVSDGTYYSSLREQLAENDVDLRSMEAEHQSLLAVEAENKERLDPIAQKSLVYRQLTLDVQVAEEKMSSLMEKLQQARIQVGGAQGNAAVIDLAVDATPTTTRPRLLLYAVVLSLMLAVGSVFVMEYLDDSLKTTEELTGEVGIIALGAIPRVKAMDKRLLAPGDAGSPLFESYRIVRSGVRFAAVNNPIRQILVTSSLAAEGKSSTAVNLAVVMAAGGQRVLLVDADLRNPTIHRLMGIEPRVGLTSILLGEAALADCILTTPYERLTVLPCGPVPPNPVELFESQGLRELIAELRNYADIVIFDSAPLLPVTDSSLLASMLDASVLVLAAGEVTRDDASNSRRILENAGARLIGGILNKVRHGSRQGEGYYGRYPYSDDGKGGDGKPTGGGRSRLTRSMSDLAGRVTGRN